jgi:hypothetical protein
LLVAVAVRLELVTVVSVVVVLAVIVRVLSVRTLVVAHQQNRFWLFSSVTR